MAKSSKKVKTIDKWRKKKFYSLFAPKLFQERELGQSAAYEPTNLLGRRVPVNLMVLTGNVKKQHINVTFKVVKVQGDSAYTDISKYEIVAAAIKRKVRRQKDRIDNSFKAVTKDNKLVRIKPMIITVSKTSRAVRSELRKALKRFLTNFMAKNDYDSLMNDIINEKLQKEAKFSLSKIAPLRSIDIRSLILLKQEASAKDQSK